MSGDAEDNLETELAALTRWEGGDVHAWRAALATDRRMASGSILQRFWQRHANWLPLGIAAAVVVLVLLPVFHTVGISAQRTSAWRNSSVSSPAPAEPQFEGYYSAARSGDAAADGRRVDGSFDGDGIPAPGLLARAEEKQARAGSSPTTSERSAALADRYVIRKATIELRTADVRAAFLKAAHLVSEAQGEYVQESSLTGGEQRLEGNLTLRVAADRLSAVLQALRELGTIRTETAGGEDVTTQVVDLEARLRNEQRVEAELLQLMEKRTDAPLKDVLELRAAIGNVRQTIETLTAQRERLGRLVSLATVLVIIRTADDSYPATPGLWDYFTSAVSRAAQRGVQALINTLAGIVLVLIGGAFWIAVAIILLIVWRVRRTARIKAG